MKAHDHRPLVHPTWDPWLVGGFSLVVWALFLVLLRPAPTPLVTAAVFYLAFVANFPHFLLSYQILYGDYRKKLLSSWRFVWAAFLSPIMIGGCLVLGALHPDTGLMGICAQFMLFTVVWHAVKQIYGVMVVCGELAGNPITPAERKWLLPNLYGLWIASWIFFNTGSRQSQFLNTVFPPVNLPTWAPTLSLLFLGVTGAGLAWVWTQKYIQTGRLVSPNGFLAFAAGYAWYLPVLYHPSFILLTPFFHAIQYMPFVYRLRKGRTEDSTRGQSPSQKRAQEVRNVWAYFAIAILGGVFFLDWLPKRLDVWLAQTSTSILTFQMLGAVNIFVNLHHYFIDNVIWKGDIPEFRQHVLGRNTEPKESNLQIRAS